MGQMRTVSKGGARSVLTFVDNNSILVVAYFMQHKGEVAARLSEFKPFYENQWGKNFKCVRSEKRTKFFSEKVA